MRRSYRLHFAVHPYIGRTFEPVRNGFGAFFVNSTKATG